MTTEEFLRYMWPDEGPYCIAYDFATRDFDAKGRPIRPVTHRSFMNITTAAEFCANNPTSNVWFTLHSLKERTVPGKVKDRKTGEIVDKEQVRTHANMKACRTFFFDLDCNGVDDDKHYSTRKAALEDLERFMELVGLPMPTLVSSGNGIHVYWRMDDDMPTEDWKPYAERLKALTVHHKLRVDPVRVSDQSSVLRVVGTYNNKPGRERKRIELRTELISYPTDMILDILRDATISAGIGITSRTVQSRALAEDDGFGSNLEKTYGPPMPARAIAAACPQMLRIMNLQGDVSEPEWYAALQVMRFSTNPERDVHLLSSGYPQYDPAEVERKVDQLVSKNIGPTTCAKMVSVCGPDACFDCKYTEQWNGTGKGPLFWAQLEAEAEPPVVEPPPGYNDAPVELPNPPAPYKRKPDGTGVTKTTKNKDGILDEKMIIPYDMYPMRRIASSRDEMEYIDWCVKRPRDPETHTFRVTASALYDSRVLAQQLAGQGVYTDPENTKDVMSYMSAYIRELQKSAEADKQHPHLGWTNDREAFVLPDKVLHCDGRVTQSFLSESAENVSDTVTKAGTLQKQVELLKFFNHPAYIQNQLFILGSLAAPLFWMTDKHGVVVNASGEPGAAKSTSLYMAASLWGQPEMYPINGTNTGATEKYRFEKALMLSTMPVMVDEVTMLEQKQASDLCLGITQPGHRERLEKSGKIKKSEGGHKATVMLTTANSSLHSILAQQNVSGAAGSMRVVEMIFKRKYVHKKYEADDFIHEMNGNYGHIGEIFMAHVVTNKDKIFLRVRQLMKELDIEGKLEGSERFWSAYFATALVACEILVMLGIVSWDVVAIRRYMMGELLAQMRGVIHEEYQAPVGVLADFLEKINGNILITDANFNGRANVPQQPRGELLARLDKAEGIMFVSQKAFKDYCRAVGANHREIIDTLHTPIQISESKRARVIPNRMIKKVLGAGTDIAKAQSWCFSIDMSHPDIAGIEFAENPKDKRGHLKVIK